MTLQEAAREPKQYGHTCIWCFRVIHFYRGRWHHPRGVRGHNASPA